MRGSACEVVESDPRTVAGAAPRRAGSARSSASSARPRDAARKACARRRRRDAAGIRSARRVLLVLGVGRTPFALLAEQLGRRRRQPGRRAPAHRRPAGPAAASRGSPTRSSSRATPTSSSPSRTATRTTSRRSREYLRDNPAWRTTKAARERPHLRLDRQLAAAAVHRRRRGRSATCAEVPEELTAAWPAQTVGRRGGGSRRARWPRRRRVARARRGRRPARATCSTRCPAAARRRARSSEIVADAAAAAHGRRRSSSAPRSASPARCCRARSATRSPRPDVIGVTGGAGFGAVLILLVFPGSIALLPVGALSSACSPRRSSSRSPGPGATAAASARLILAGIAISALFAAATTSSDDRLPRPRAVGGVLASPAG